MRYTASSEEHVEIGSLLVPLSLKRKLIGVRPASLIVATCASREHAKETCCCFRTYCSSPREAMMSFKGEGVACM